MKHLRILFTVILFFFAGIVLAQSPGSESTFDEYRGKFHHGVLAIQIQLDRRNLSCNRIDGFWGTRTEIAFRTWQKLSAREETGVPTDEELALLGGTNNLFRTLQITSEELALLTQIPADWSGKAKLKHMGYSSAIEKYAEMGHCSERLLQRLNPDVAWPNPAAGTQILIPNCTPIEKSAHAGSLSVSLSRFELAAFDLEGTLIALFPCSIARKKSQRPEGLLEVTTTIPNPTYLYDPQLFTPGADNYTKLTLPPGPNSPVGTAWIGLNRSGFGIHGTPTPERIGEAASHGCFRLANWNAEKILKLVSEGTPVLISE